MPGACSMARLDGAKRAIGQRPQMRGVMSGLSASVAHPMLLRQKTARSRAKPRDPAGAALFCLPRVLPICALRHGNVILAR